MTTIDDRQKVFGFVLPVGSDGELIKQTILTYLGVGLMIIVFIVFLLPRLSELVTSSSAVDELHKKEVSINLATEALDDFKARVDVQARDLVYLAMPTRFDPGLILLSLRKLASDKNVNLISYSLSGGQIQGGVPAKTSSQLENHIIDASISGPADELLEFVDGLDRYLPIVTVANLSISEVNKLYVSASSDLRLDVGLNYYHMPIAMDSAKVLSSKLLSQKEYDLIRSLVGYNHLLSTPSGTTSVETGGKKMLFD